MSDDKVKSIRVVYVKILSHIPGRVTFQYWRKENRSDALRGECRHPAKEQFEQAIQDETGLKYFTIQFVKE